MSVHPGSAEAGSVKPGSVKAWILASRLPTLGAAIVPVAIGAAVAAASDGLRWLPTLAALWGSIWIQIGTNFANDVFDYEKGADTGDRLGPTRAVQAGLLTPGAMRKGMAIAFALAFAAGVYLAWAAGWPIIVIGIVSILSGIAYTGGPYPLGYNGLGDVFVMVFFGFVAVGGTVWVNLLALPSLTWWAAIPPGALATAILVVNNVRDRGTDVLAGKRTLAVRFGRRAALAEYAGLLMAAYAIPLWLGLTLGLSASMPLLTLPWGLFLMRALVTREGQALNSILVSTAKLLIVHGLLFASGLALL